MNDVSPESMVSTTTEFSPADKDGEGLKMICEVGSG
jgi:hypothetical protein